MAGTTKPSNLGSFTWAAETGFATTGTDSVTTRMIVRDDAIDVSGLSRPLVDRGGVFQYLDDGEPHVVGPFGTNGTFSVTFDLAGHGTTTAGALQQTNLHKLLAHVFGGADASDNGGAESGTGSDVDTLKPNGGSESFTPGGMLRVGSFGDGSGEAQAYAVSSVTGTPNTTVELLTGLAGGAPAGGEVLYAMMHLWPRVDSAGTIITSDGSTSNNTLRVLLQTANLQFICRGVAATGATITGLSPGEIPQINVTFTAAAWEPLAATFPSTASITEHYAAPVAAGSMFVQDRATTTWAGDVPRNFEISLGFGVQPITGTDGSGGTYPEGATLYGYRRVNARTTVNVTVEAQAATTSPTWWTYHGTDPNSITLKHLLYTCNPHDGRAIAFYFPRLRPAGSVPTQTSVDGLNYVTASFEALSIDDTTVSSTIQNAPWVLSMG